MTRDDVFAFFYHCNSFLSLFQITNLQHWSCQFQKVLSHLCRPNGYLFIAYCNYLIQKNNPPLLFYYLCNNVRETAVFGRQTLKFLVQKDLNIISICYFMVEIAIRPLNRSKITFSIKNMTRDDVFAFFYHCNSFLSLFQITNLQHWSCQFQKVLSHLCRPNGYLFIAYLVGLQNANFILIPKIYQELGYFPGKDERFSFRIPLNK